MTESPIRPLSQQQIRELAGAGTFERGEQYASGGRVISLTVNGGMITALVQGTEVYEVKLWQRGKKLQYSCTCPFAVEGAFCKHCVAVTLV